jgi:curved DNA-binding protein CbpA
MNTTTLDPYATLGIPRGASEQQVRQAYRRLAKRYHPDLHPTVDATERMQRVNQAWELLSSPVRRASYEADFAARGSAGIRYSSASTRWNGTSASRPPRARVYTSARSPYAAQGGGSGCAAVALIAVICLLVVIAMSTGIIPFPLVGLALFAVIRGSFGLFNGGRR